MDRNSPYFEQVELLVRVLPTVANEHCFALKGGSAINLFVRNLPRLSVDIDLVYLPLDERETALTNINSAMDRIANSLETSSPSYDVIRQFDNDSKRLLVGNGSVQVKVELSPVLRGTVYPPVEMTITEQVEDLFGYAKIQVLGLADLYGGKICAALDRQHPRDLFDVKLLLENEGIDRELMKAFLVYLISHNRPIAELISPKIRDIKDDFTNHFDGMTTDELSLNDLEEAREELISTIQNSITDLDKNFLLTFKSGDPDWNLLDLKNVDRLPAVKWKLRNINRMNHHKNSTSWANLAAILEKF